MSGTRDRIIAATNELFRLRGYHGTTLSQISEASEATIGSIYHFFPGGKEALTVAVITNTGAAYRELFEMIATGADDPRMAFADFFEGAADVLAESDFLDPCPIGTVAREVASTNEPIRIAAKASFDSWVEAASLHLSKCDIAPDDAAELAVLFVATVEGSFVLSRTQRSVTPMLTAGRWLTKLLESTPTTAEGRPLRPD